MSCWTSSGASNPNTARLPMLSLMSFCPSSSICLAASMIGPRMSYSTLASLADLVIGFMMLFLSIWAKTTVQAHWQTDVSASTVTGNLDGIYNLTTQKAVFSGKGHTNGSLQSPFFQPPTAL